MKKIISILLILTLALSLTPAALALEGFTDKDDVKCIEAVDVLIGIGAVEGYGDGTINPKGTLTREQGAKLVTYAVLGKAEAEKLTPPAHNSFSDVGNHSWSSSYIGFLEARCIATGYGDGTFHPTAPVTGTQAAKMMLCAVGYGAKGEYDGADWETNVAADANAANLYAGLPEAFGGNPCTREEAFQVTYNGLMAETVRYDKAKDKYVGTGLTLLEQQGGTGDVSQSVCYVNYAAKGPDGDPAVRAWYIDGKTQTHFTADAKITDITSLIGVKGYALNSDNEIMITAYAGEEYKAVVSGSVSFKPDMKSCALGVVDENTTLTTSGMGTVKSYTGVKNFPTISHSASVENAVFYRVVGGHVTDIVLINYMELSYDAPTTETITGVLFTEMDDVFNIDVYAQTGPDHTWEPANSVKGPYSLSLTPPEEYQSKIYTCTIRDGAIIAMDFVADLPMVE